MKQVNERLWKVEDELRDCEPQQAFGAPFVELARSVYRTNDRGVALKRQINELLGYPGRLPWKNRRNYLRAIVGVQSKVLSM